MSRTGTCLIFNPSAGQNDPEQDLAKIRALLEPEFNLDIRLTTEEVDADTIASDAIAQGASSIIAAGGDGTLSATAAALVGTNISLGVIPRGTANAEIELEDKVISVTAAAVTVANAAPPTSFLAQGPAGVIFDDGLLDITVVSPVSRAGAIAASSHLLRTALSKTVAAERDDIGYLRAKRLIVRTEPPQKVVLDGEVIGTTPIDVECVPGGLTIFVPLDAAPPSRIEKLEGLPDLTIEPKSTAGFEEEK